ncbi:MAG: hypothetical protein GVX90_02840 [Alphaproteobacteria bacterium]|jgi:hypothetical protein|nr:hypothetical protein [Alphaproteobacteria bacterium]
MIRLAALAALFAAAPAIAEDRLAPGIWTNTEDTYFAEGEGRERAPDRLFEVADDGRWRALDAFAQPQGEWAGGPIPGLTARAVGGWQLKGSEIRRLRRFTCKLSVRRFAGKPDDRADWTFARGLKLFDQGGRVLVSGNGAAPDITLGMRDVTWPKGIRNRPGLVLYVHRDDSERAESYVWASPDAGFVGINLRRVQGNCAIDEGDRQAWNRPAP